MKLYFALDVTERGKKYQPIAGLGAERVVKSIGLTEFVNKIQFIFLGFQSS